MTDVPDPDLAERVEALELQVSVLTDALTELAAAVTIAANGLAPLVDALAAAVETPPIHFHSKENHVSGKTITIPVDPPLTGHNGPIKQVVIREPRFSEYRELGDPFIIASSTDGNPYVVEKSEVLQQYEELLITEPGTELLTQGSWRLARDIRQAVLGLFLRGAEAGGASETLPTTSPSAASSDPMISMT